MKATRTCQQELLHDIRLSTDIEIVDYNNKSLACDVRVYTT